MHYGKLNKCDIANGIGVRVSLFVSGCRNHCKGCFNPETWDFGYGEKYDYHTVSEISEALNRPYIKGLSILGGDPFEPENIEAVTALCRFIRVHFGDTKDIWVYTGYTYEDIKDSELLLYADVLVDGKFIESEKDLSLRFKGSRNQRIIDVSKSLDFNKVVLWEDKNEKDLMMYQKKMNRKED